MKLVFVYNTRLNAKSLLNDFVHEVLPNKQANCKLCDITYSLAWKKRAWKDYLNSLDMEYEFYFIEEFERAFPAQKNLSYPCIYLAHPKNAKLDLIISKQEIDDLENLEELINALKKTLQARKTG